MFCYSSTVYRVLPTEGVIIKLKKTKEFVALVKLLNLIPVKELTIDRKIHKTRCDISSKTIGEKTERYNLRHTVLAQRVASERVSHKIVAQEAGHTTIRMIDENYGKKFIKEDKNFDELVFIKKIEPSYRGWLLQACLIVKYPSLRNFIVPNDKFLKELFAQMEEKEAEKDLLAI